jgi:peptidyl-dipeptidase A
MRDTSKWLAAALAVACTMTTVAAASAAAPAPEPGPAASQAPAVTTTVRPTRQEAERFVAAAEKRSEELVVAASRASWVQANFITYDTEILAAQANERLTAVGVELAKQAARFDGLDLPYDVRRKLDLIKLSLTLPAPADPAKNAELARVAADLEGQYGKGKYCPPGGKCLTFEDIATIMRESRDPVQLADVWTGWHKIAPPMKPVFERYVELGNEGARELGYKDVGTFWRAKYDMPPDAFAAEVDRLWNQVKPFYDQLHCYVRARLNEKYGSQVVPLDQPIRADLLGDMWAQSWSNIYPLVAPPDADPGYDLTERLVAKKTEPLEMVRYGERFFTSLGFAPLPKTFWERSLFLRPKDRDVICHPSAWDIDGVDDLRLKMCIEINQDDFLTVHHELGHNFYQRAYDRQAPLYRDSANDGFHEAVGDTIALSVTPEYLQRIGLIDKVPDTSKDLGLLMNRALDKIAFLPFGLLIDQWRWKVFAGEIRPADYNRTWWELRRKYQGVRPPVARSEADFDPGAKYHVPAGVPYTRYFLADILQFQFHRALCQAAGYHGPLNRCSIYENKAAGRRLAQMLELGQSRPWPEALKVLTGSERMDATAILDYFKPLQVWLEKQNQGRTCGW